MPVSLLEAMAAGCPSVATDVGGVAQVLRGGVTGLLVPPADPDALAQAINYYLNDPVRAHETGEQARATAVEQYGTRAWAQKWEELYLEVIGN
jgi:glycosyltransferase involved in cell wall biosynthesis